MRRRLQRSPIFQTQNDAIGSTRAHAFALTGKRRERIAALLTQHYSMQCTHYRGHDASGRFDFVMSTMADGVG